MSNNSAFVLLRHAKLCPVDIHARFIPLFPRLSTSFLRRVLFAAHKNVRDCFLLLMEFISPVSLFLLTRFHLELHTHTHTHVILYSTL